MAETATYAARLRAYQQAYCSTLDEKTAALRLHEAAIRYVRQAAAAREPVRRLILENRALRILNALTGAVRTSRAHPGANADVCDKLIAVYHAASLAVHRGQYETSEKLIAALLKPPATAPS